MISTEELIIALENNSSESDLKSVLENLLEAINDWPTSLSEPSELVSELKLQIKAKLTVSNIKSFKQSLKDENEGWKIESLSSLLNIFDIACNENIDEELEFEVLLEKLTNHLKS